VNLLPLLLTTRQNDEFRPTEFPGLNEIRKVVRLMIENMAVI
jgi:hypothetical protein